MVIPLPPPKKIDSPPLPIYHTGRNTNPWEKPDSMFSVFFFPLNWHLCFCLPLWFLKKQKPSGGVEARKGDVFSIARSSFVFVPRHHGVPGQLTYIALSQNNGKSDGENDDGTLSNWRNKLKPRVHLKSRIWKSIYRSEGDGAPTSLGGMS